jgi:hypothetical protein
VRGRLIAAAKWETECVRNGLRNEQIIYSRYSTIYSNGDIKKSAACSIACNGAGCLMELFIKKYIYGGENK